jgi:hypothetical protein
LRGLQQALDRFRVEQRGVILRLQHAPLRRRIANVRRFRDRLFEPVLSAPDAVHEAEDRKVLHRRCDDDAIGGDLHAVIALACAIGLKVATEGVETAQQEQFLRIAGCHYLQGYLFSKPVPAAEIDEMRAASSSKVIRTA